VKPGGTTLNRGIRTFGNGGLLLLYNVGALRSGAQRSTPGGTKNQLQQS